MVGLDAIANPIKIPARKWYFLRVLGGGFLASPFQ